MTDAPTTLDYAVPAERRCWPVLRMTAAVALTLTALWVAAWFLPTTLSMGRNHNSSFGGCGTGRLHGAELLIMAVVPLGAGLTARALRWLGVWPAWRVARLCTAAIVSAYAVLWMNVLGVLHLIKFGSFFA